MFGKVVQCSYIPIFLMNESNQPKLTLEDIEAVFCGRNTPEQHARYCAEFDDPNSELNAMLTHIRTSETNVLNQALPSPRRKKRIE